VAKVRLAQSVLVMSPKPTKFGGTALVKENKTPNLGPYALKRRKKLVHLLRLVSSHPGGISTNDIVTLSYGPVRQGARSSELEHARLGATRKLLQRANKLLQQYHSRDVIVYCKVKKLWLLKEVI
jgi:hypothetical protein